MILANTLMEKSLDIVVSGLLLLAGIGMLFMTFGEAFEVRTFGGDVGPAFAPRMFLTVWVILAFFALLGAIRGKVRSTADSPDIVRMVTVIAVATGTAIAMTKIGFVFSMIPGLALFCWVFGYRKIWQLILISILAPLFLWALFTFGFELLLPRSPWFHQI